MMQFFVHYVAMNALFNKPFPNDELVIFGGSDYGYCVALRETSRTLDFLKGGEEPTSFTFSERVRRIALKGDAFGTPDEPEDETYQLPAPKAGPSLCQYLLGAAWERHAEEMTAKLPHNAGKNGKVFALVKEWPKDCAFFFHLRNACFHGGTFDIKPVHMPEARDASHPDPYPEWRHLPKIDDFAAIKGKPVFGPDGMLHVDDVPLLLHDIGKAIDREMGPRTADW